MLPRRFHRVELRAQSGVRYEEADVSFYNRTRFAGLENDLPNAYANALLQVLRASACTMA
jgi:PAB-dependent poly(A)-specific ribonuclease subunit 2